MSVTICSTHILYVPIAVPYNVPQYTGFQGWWWHNAGFSNGNPWSTGGATYAFVSRSWVFLWVSDMSEWATDPLDRVGIHCIYIAKGLGVMWLCTFSCICAWYDMYCRCWIGKKSTWLHDVWIGANRPKSAGRGACDKYRWCSHGYGMSR